MKKTKIIIFPTYNGNGLLIVDSKNVKIESLPGYIEEIILRWQWHYNRMIDDKEATIRIDRIYELGIKIAAELKEYLPEYSIKYATLKDISSQMGEDMLMEAKAREKLENYDEAIFFFKRRLNLNEKKMDYIVDLAVCLFNCQRYNEALIFLKMLLRMSREKRIINYLLALCNYFLEDYLWAEYYFDILLEDKTEEKDVFIFAASTYLALGNYEKAKSTLKLGNYMLPNSGEILKELAKIYHHKEDYEHENDILQKLVVIHPMEKEAFELLADSYSNIGKYAEAIHSFKVVLKLDPNVGAYYYKLAQLYASLDNDNLAVEMYLKAILKNPDFTKYFWGKTNFLLNLKIDHDFKAYLLSFGAKYGDKNAEKYLNHQRHQ